ncbi:MAG: hypothetical protein GEV28_03040 [Actinophytocola sp.]|uniref:hypothetical protein n=1 Tax=Actinophytocola sp. TaxID=1872138 RepID=UPI001325330B|nr:hypothetical protein [Actinophytocola sp.]MPZ79409.1 hypothetical protein [Actinophytocola sp.]
MTHDVIGEWRWGAELDSVVVAPKSHRVVFENEHVRVLEIEVQPGSREPEHTHRLPSVMMTDRPARIRYRIGDEVIFESPDPLPPPVELTATWYGPQGPHSVENIDTVPMRAIRVELKDA